MNAPERVTPEAHADLLAGLNEKQHEAVTMPSQSAIILAGAGSGKTKVLTTRIAYLLRNQTTTNERIMAVTFTNKAAKEMKDRLAKMINPMGDDSVETNKVVRNMWIGTFHGLCNRMLRDNYRAAGLPASFSIMDQDDQLAMIKRMLKDMKTAPEIKPSELQGFIVRNKDAGYRPGHIDVFDEDSKFKAEFYAMYETQCSKEGVIDFSELMLRTVEMFRSNPEFLHCYRGLFTHIHVDEFQDTSPIQYEWLRALKDDNASIFAVGDDDQSIYAFRGSDPRNMMDFVKEVANDKVIRLEQNYRSTGYILNAANALIEQNSGRMGKNLWTDAGEGMKMQSRRFQNDLDEADHVADAVKRKIQAGVDPSQIAILYRSNFQSRGYEKALMSRAVPYVIYGGTKFYERMEVKNVLGYLRLTTNLNDDGAFRRIINFPPRGIGEATVDQIAQIAKEKDVPMLEAAADHYDGKAKPKIDDFIGLLANFFDASTRLNLPDFINHVIKTSGLMDQYGKKDEDKDRLMNVTEMVTAAKRFCEEMGAETLKQPAVEVIHEFMSSTSLESSADVAQSEGKREYVQPKAVTLMTVHAAKGLEFDHVVIGGAEENVFPWQMAVDTGDVEEERRLMYVGITRARKELMVTSSANRMIYGETKSLEISRFMEEIPADLKDEREFGLKTQNYQAKKPAFRFGKR